MGAAHSRARPGAGPAKIAKQTHELGVTESSFGYFILCIKPWDRIKIVNASNNVLKLVTNVIKVLAWHSHMRWRVELIKRVLLVESDHL